MHSHAVSAAMIEVNDSVLILVVMEDALALSLDSYDRVSMSIVLILVVMEDALAQS